MPTLPGGTLSFPLVGFIKAAEHSPAEVRESLTERIKRFIPYPVVTASVREVAGNRVYVLGHVEKPGEYRANRQLDVLQTLSLAGGVTVQPNEMGIMIIRHENGHQKVYSFNYSGIKGGLGLEAKIILRSGDTVIVPGGFWQ